MKVLIVDDEQAMGRLFEQRFRKEIREGRLELVCALSGEAALAVLDSGGGEHADVVMILSDINMPGMSGLELLRQLRARGLSTPIYMISAYESTDYQEKSREFGATDFLPKPLDFAAIRRIFFPGMP